LQKSPKYPAILSSTSVNSSNVCKYKKSHNLFTFSLFWELFIPLHDKFSKEWCVWIPQAWRDIWEVLRGTCLAVGSFANKLGVRKLRGKTTTAGEHAITIWPNQLNGQALLQLITYSRSSVFIYTRIDCGERIDDLWGTTAQALISTETGTLTGEGVRCHIGFNIFINAPLH